MARKGTQQNGTITFATASEELAVRLVKVYKSQTFVHSGKELADELFKTGVEAGALLSGIPELTARQAKIDAANQAIIKLKQVSYIADVMCKAELYKSAEITPLVQYINHTVNALKELLSSIPEEQPIVRVAQPVAVTVKNPVITTKPVLPTSIPFKRSAPVKSKPEIEATAQPEIAATAEQAYSDDGFNDPV